MSTPRLCLLPLAALCLTTRAAEPVWEVDGGLGMTGGEWTYSIGGDFTQDGQTQSLHFPISELEWPTTGVRLQGRAQVELGRIIGHGQFGLLVSGGGSEMIDSDWEDLENPGARTTYSESDTEAEAWEADAGVLFTLHQGPSLFLRAGAGYLRQSWSWEASDTLQVSVIPEDNGSISGKVITYDGDLDVPYLQVAAEWRNGPVTLRGRLGASAWASAEDEDNHLLRGIVSEADTDGDALLAEARMHIDLTKTVFGFMEARMLLVETEGTSRNRVTDAAAADEPLGATWEIDEEISIRQFSGVAGVGVRL